MNMRSDLKETLHYLQNHPDFLNLRDLSGIRVDLKYATSDNFMGRNVYGEFNEAFLHRVAAEKLRDAQARLKSLRPKWSLLVLDALRPRSIQRVLWAHVEGTEEEAYVAHPDRGSVHNFGLAVDLTCVDETGQWVEMGSDFDSFHPISQPKLEGHFLETGELSADHHENRLALRRVMTESGFFQLPHEWWHFDALERSKIREGFELIE